LQPGKDYLDFRPGLPLNDTVGIFRTPYRRESPPDEDLLEHYSSMVLSRCYRQSQGKLSCISCHSPHSEPSPAESPAYYRGKCLSCHTDNSCAFPLASRLEQRPQNDCAGCHLPKRQIKTIAHSALSNHRILARPGEHLPESAFQEPASLPDLIHVNAVPDQERRPVPLLTQLQIYGELLSPNPAYQERYLAVLDQLSKLKPEPPLVLSALARKAKLQGTPEGNRLAMEYLSKAIQAGSTSDSDFQDFADLLARSGQTEQAVTTLKQGIEKAPFNPLFYKALTLQYIHQKNYAKALETMKRHLELFPDDLFMAKLIRQVEASSKPQ
jgi:tetratricopeptide (TPR) repeat protein